MQRQQTRTTSDNGKQQPQAKMASSKFMTAQRLGNILIMTVGNGKQRLRVTTTGNNNNNNNNNNA